MRAVTRVHRFTHGTQQRKLGDALRMLEDVTRPTLQIEAGKKKEACYLSPSVRSMIVSCVFLRNTPDVNLHKLEVTLEYIKRARVAFLLFV